MTFPKVQQIRTEMPTFDKRARRRLPSYGYALVDMIYEYKPKVVILLLKKKAIFAQQ
jgi:hypothetical protein